MKRTALLLALVFACLLCFAACNDGDENAEPVTFRAASYNVHCANTQTELLKGCAEQLNSYDIDIAGLQEVDTDMSFRCPKAMSILTAGPELIHSNFAPTIPIFIGQYGIMTVSAHEILETSRVDLFYGDGMASSDVEPRVLQRSIIEIDGVRIAFYNTHLDFTGEKIDGEVISVTQMREVFETVDADPTPYKIVTGDFNANSFDLFDIFVEDGDHSLVSNPETPLETFPTGNNFRCIDNIIYTHDTLELLASDVVDSPYSDHLMLYADFKVK